MSDFADRQRFLTPVQRQTETVELLRGEHRRAVLRVCQDAQTIEDVRYLLDVLGLDPREGRREPPSDVAVSRVGAVRAGGSWNDSGKVGGRRKRKETG